MLRRGTLNHVGFSFSCVFRQRPNLPTVVAWCYYIYTRAHTHTLKHRLLDTATDVQMARNCGTRGIRCFYPLHRLGFVLDFYTYMYMYIVIIIIVKFYEVREINAFFEMLLSVLNIIWDGMFFLNILKKKKKK